MEERIEGRGWRKGYKKGNGGKDIRKRMEERI
jgi:hypothetical protein